MRREVPCEVANNALSPGRYLSPASYQLPPLEIAAVKILFVSSEVAPFAKTGGLADVCGALPRELAKLGHQVSVFMPYYRQVKHSNTPRERLNVKFDIPVGSRIVRGMLWKSQIPDSDVTVYFLENDEYYDRPELYRDQGVDYKDNCERFAFLCRAALESTRILQQEVDVYHCHDWQTGLIPAYLQVEYQHAAGYQYSAAVLTIHNLAYQGVFWHWDMLLTGLDWRFFNMHQMEFYGKLNLLKTGIVFADAITTVSENYAAEIQTPEQGCGLEGSLQQRQGILSGIVNGVDYSIWSPEQDPHLPTQYNAGNWATGKAACKAALQREMGLPVSPATPVIGLVGRLADQKGWDLVIDMMQRWAETNDIHWAVLGTGEPHYHDELRHLNARFPHRVAARFEFSDPLAHLIEAGSDMFLMPSRYEPCGLNQLYSLRYGTVPIVRATGGLVDTVVDATDENIQQRTATGFVFQAYDVAEMEQAIGRALGVFHQQPEVWRQIVDTGMRADWSWFRSAQRYEQVYREAMERKAVRYERILESENY